MRIRSTTLSLGIAAILALGASACSNPVESLIEEALGQSGVEIERDGSGISIETEDGDIRIGMSQSVPDDFPARVPVPSGKLVATSVIENMWILTYEGFSQGDVEKALASLEAAGFEELSSQSMEGFVNAIHVSDDLFVTVMWSDDDEDQLLIYGVTQEVEE